VYEEATIQFRAGDLLLLYTDCITEARNLKGQYYEVERLLDVAQRRREHMPSDELIDMIHRDVYEFTRGESPQDDVTVIVVQLRNVEQEVAETA
jgi:serine phosphatase RsbU (regulator of sigma subunit)